MQLRKQFYPVVVHLGTSKLSVTIMGNMVFSNKKIEPLDTMPPTTRGKSSKKRSKNVPESSDGMPAVTIHAPDIMVAVGDSSLVVSSCVNCLHEEREQFSTYKLCRIISTRYIHLTAVWQCARVTHGRI